MQPTLLRSAAVLALLAGAGCTVLPPSGPSVVAMPRQGEDFAAFNRADAACRDHADVQTNGGPAAAAASQNAVGSAAVGTAVGAAAGAALGSLGGRAGTGAVAGAIGGLAVGSAVGAGNAQTSAYGMQRRYDIAYMQCMTAAGYSIQQPQQQPVYMAAPYPYPPVYAYPYPYPYPYYPYYSYGVGIHIGPGRWHR